MNSPLFKGQKAFYQSLFTIAVPIMFQNFINSMVNILDTIMIGLLGTVEIAAVGLGNQIFFLYNLILFGICSGGTIFTAQFWGKKDIAGIRKNLGFCLSLNLFAAFFFTLGAALIPERFIAIYSEDPAVIEAGAAYLKALSPGFIPFALSLAIVLTLRSVEKVRLTIIATLIALSLNLCLNYFLIFGVGPFPVLGVRGAAIATVIARYVETAVLIAGCYRERYPPAGRPSELFAFNGRYALKFLKVALPVILNELFWSVGITTQNLIFARTSTEAIAAFNITNTVSQLTWVVFIGMGNGIAVLIGKKIGEGNETLARDYAYRITRFAPMLSLGAACVLIPLSRLLPFVFNAGPEVLSIAGVMFLILASSYPFRAFNMSMIIGICRAGGDTVFCIFYDVVSMWVITLPLAAAAAFIFHAPPAFIYFCVCVEEPLKMFIGIWRLKTGKWLHNVIN